MEVAGETGKATLDCGESQRRITALAVDVDPGSGLVSNHGEFPH
jgi:hypothetical protein